MADLVQEIANHISAISSLMEIPVSVSNERTPYRVAKMYCNELFKNRNGANLEELNSQMKVFPNEGVTTPITVSDIEFCSTCFTAKTPVRMKDGVKYIRDIKIGDIALTFDELGNLVERPVTHVMSRKVNETLIVHTSNGKSLRCTPDHPFYVENKGWVEAQDLEPHDCLRTLKKGKDLGKNVNWDFTINEGYEFGYVLGAIASDGSTWRNQTRLEVNDGYFAERFCECLKVAFNIEAKVTKSKYSSGFTPNKFNNRFLVRVISGYFVDYLKTIFGGSTNSLNFVFPEIVLNSFESFKGFLHGYIDGDGYIYKNKYARIITANKNFAFKLSNILGTSLSHKERNIFVISVPIHLMGLEKRKSFAERFLLKFEESLKNKTPVRVNPLMSYTEVVSIEELPKHEVTVYNFEVEENHTYLAGDIWVHNCEHHWLPFMGLVTVSYVPDKTIVGLSKIPRVVKYFSQRPQLQERLTKDIGEYLVNLLQPRSLTVEVTATHTCVMCRGAESNCSTSTSFVYKEEQP